MHPQIKGRPLFGGNYERAGGGLQKRENILKSGPVTVNSRAVIQIRAGNSVFGAVIQLPPRFIFGREREMPTWGRAGGGITNFGP